MKIQSDADSLGRMETAPRDAVEMLRQAAVSAQANFDLLLSKGVVSPNGNYASVLTELADDFECVAKHGSGYLLNQLSLKWFPAKIA